LRFNEIQKVLISLSTRFDPKISSLEEIKNIDTLSMDELHAIFIAYEMRKEQNTPSKKEENFKESKRTEKKNKNDSNTNCSYINDSDEDE
jgi:cell division protein ZapA (FtsZ GTPase activity inhibitor)